MSRTYNRYLDQPPAHPAGGGSGQLRRQEQPRPAQPKAAPARPAGGLGELLGGLLRGGSGEAPDTGDILLVLIILLLLVEGDELELIITLGLLLLLGPGDN